jgi:hypothetical protein
VVLKPNKPLNQCVYFNELLMITLAIHLAAASFQDNYFDQKQHRGFKAKQTFESMCLL